MSAAARLASSCELTLFERNSYVGGHTNTVVVSSGDQAVPVDTGFMVYNEVTYPRLTALFCDLGVETQPTDMSFGVHHRSRDLYWSSRFPFGFLAQTRNLARPAFWRMVRDLTRFNRQATRILDDPAWSERSMADLVESLGLSRTFLDLYLLPMIAAIWSSPHDQMLEFPAVTMIRFLHNHGLLGVTTQHPWRTVVGGSRQYREKLIAPFRDRIELARPATGLTRTPEGRVVVADSTGARHLFDAVIVATHGDEALALLEQPTDDETRLLGAFSYAANEVVLHTDEHVMPPRRRAWASWNYEIHPTYPDGTGALAASTHYWMNALQKLPTAQPYFVSVNPAPASIDPAKICWSTTYHHPTFDLPAARAQRELPLLNAAGPIYFAGSYFRYGFHEDALMAGEAAASALLSSHHASSPPLLTV